MDLRGHISTGLLHPAWAILGSLPSCPHILDDRVIPSVNHSISAGAFIGVMCLGTSLLRQRRVTWIVGCVALCAAVGAFVHASNEFDPLSSLGGGRKALIAEGLLREARGLSRERQIRRRVL